MLYWLAEWLGFPGVLNLIRYLSFRSGAAVATALIIGLWIGPRFILMLRMRQGKGQPIRDDGPQSHLAKKGTPTMGGLMILISLMISALLWMDLSNRFVWACLFVTGGFAVVGFLDGWRGLVFACVEANYVREKAIKHWLLARGANNRYVVQSCSRSRIAPSGLSDFS